MPALEFAEKEPIMNKSLAGIITWGSLLLAAVAEPAEDAAGWATALQRARAESMEYARKYGSRVLCRIEKSSKKGDVKKIEVDLSGAEVLWLKTESGNDRNDFDYAAWTEPVLFSVDGNPVRLTTLKPFHAECSTGKVKEISVKGGRRALLLHAPGRIGYRLGKKYKKLTVWTGFDPRAKRFGRAVFEVNTIPSGVNPAEFRREQWKRLEKEFPVISGILLSNFGEKECLKLLETENQVLRIEMLVRAALGPHAPAVPAGTFDSCAKSLMQLSRLYATRRKIRDHGGFTFPLIDSTIRLTGLRETIRFEFDEPMRSNLLARTAELEKKLQAVEMMLMDRAGPQTADLEALTAEVNSFVRKVTLESGWSSFRNGNTRRAVTEEVPALPLYLQWVHRAVSPEPAWPAPARENLSAGSAPLTPTQTLDYAHHTAVWKNSVFYGSSADAAVRCLDAVSGRVKWIFTAEGPVRLAPVVKYGLVFAGSDDGWIYCLDAKNGALIWKYSPAPNARRVPGNGRIISVVPVRAGLCVADGTVYFAAGLFPLEGTWLCAVDAFTGKEVYRKKLDISPQGAMLLTPEHILVPTGRTPTVLFNRSTGEKIVKLGNSTSWGRNLMGGSYAVTYGNHVVTGPSEDGHFHLFSVHKKESGCRLYGIQMTVQGDTAFLLKNNSLSAIDRNRFFRFKQNARKWRAPFPAARTMILAGPVVFVGGENRIAAFSAENGRALWSARIPGAAESLAFNNQRLYVSLIDGAICCFSTEAVSGATVDVKEPPPFHPRGYGVIAGKENAVQLAGKMVQSGMRTICVEKDFIKARELIDRLREAGIYGPVVVHLNGKPCQRGHRG